jgi:hypothetical protein
LCYFLNILHYLHRYKAINIAGVVTDLRLEDGICLYSVRKTVESYVRCDVKEDDLTYNQKGFSSLDVVLRTNTHGRDLLKRKLSEVRETVVTSRAELLASKKAVIDGDKKNKKLKKENDDLKSIHREILNPRTIFSSRSDARSKIVLKLRRHYLDCLSTSVYQITVLKLRVSELERECSQALRT